MRKSFSLVVAIYCAFSASPLSAQQPKATSGSAPDDVIRINTELIESPIIVLDKKGNFVGGLNREQFELSVDGHPRLLSFFEQIIAGTAGEAEKYEAARKGSAPRENQESRASIYGRTVIFFIDDFHLKAESINRTRTAVLNFIDHSMGQNDRGMVIAASGQIGFLSQLTDNKDVLRAAIERLKSREFFVADETKPSMDAYQAIAIQAGDSGTIRYFADFLVQDDLSRQVKQVPAGSPGQAIAQAEWRGDAKRDQAESIVRNRARNLLTRYSAVSASTFFALKQFMAALDPIPGSKLGFLISDGFFLNGQQPGELQKLNEITSGATRSGTVIYSIQASGLGNSLTTAAAEVRLSPRMDRGAPMIGQDTALQAPLYTIAVDTGGRALFNSNSMDGSIQQALRETSKYYLLAWRPDPEEKRADLFHRVQVRIKDHPELSVRMQKGYFLSVATTKTASAQPTTKPAQPEASEAQQRLEKMREALTALYPVPDLRTIVNLSFLDQPVNGAVLNIGTEVAVGRLPRRTETGKDATSIELAGIVLNDEGKTVSSFAGQLKFDLEEDTPQGQTVSHADEIKVKPGLYQVRVAARDEGSGLTGSAAEWILVPDLSKEKIALSSLLIGDSSVAGGGSDQKAQLSINHHFTRSGRLRFLTYVYNAKRGPDGKSAPDVTVQLRVMRDDQVLSTSPQLKVPTEGIEDLARIPYAAEIALRLLPQGRYWLSVTTTDNLSKSSSTQSIKFVVE
jgi:VWFA-related protein